MATLIPDGWGHGVREGLVVEFQPADGSSWVGNFEPGLGGIDDVRPHPNDTDVLVASAGQLYQVNLTTGSAHRLASAVSGVWQLLDPPRLLFNDQDLAFFCVGREGVLWSTRRISWDGFQRLRVENNALDGEAWSAIDDCWYPFQVDLADGSVVGGSYSGT